MSSSTEITHRHIHTDNNIYIHIKRCSSMQKLATKDDKIVISKRCDYLSAVGMLVDCMDSYCPSRHKCDHIIKPTCWGNVEEMELNHD